MELMVIHVTPHLYLVNDVLMTMKQLYSLVEKLDHHAEVPSRSYGVVFLSHANIMLSIPLTHKSLHIWKSRKLSNHFFAKVKILYTNKFVAVRDLVIKLCNALFMIVVMYISIGKIKIRAMKTQISYFKYHLQFGKNNLSN